MLIFGTIWKKFATISIPELKKYLLNEMKIAITGTVGSGKSGVAAILAGFMQAKSIDTDILCRDLLMKGQPGWREVRNRWPYFFSDSGDLDRVQLRNEVFEKSEIRLGLEEILHPMVRSRVEELIKESGRIYLPIVVEVPLLFEVGWNTEFDHVIAVYTPLQICIERTVARDKVSRKQVEKILALQKSPEEKAELSDSVINNSGTWAATVLQASNLANDIQPIGLDKKSMRVSSLKA